MVESIENQGSGNVASSKPSNQLDQEAAKSSGSTTSIKNNIPDCNQACKGQQALEAENDEQKLASAVSSKLHIGVPRNDAAVISSSSSSSPSTISTAPSHSVSRDSSSGSSEHTVKLYRSTSASTETVVHASGGGASEVNVDRVLNQWSPVAVQLLKIAEQQSRSAGGETSAAPSLLHHMRQVMGMSSDSAHIALTQILEQIVRTDALGDRGFPDAGTVNKVFEAYLYGLFADPDHTSGLEVDARATASRSGISERDCRLIVGVLETRHAPTSLHINELFIPGIVGEIDARVTAMSSSTPGALSEGQPGHRPHRRSEVEYVSPDSTPPASRRSSGVWGTDGDDPTVGSLTWGGRGGVDWNSLALLEPLMKTLVLVARQSPDYFDRHLIPKLDFLPFLLRLCRLYLSSTVTAHLQSTYPHLFNSDSATVPPTRAGAQSHRAKDPLLLEYSSRYQALQLHIASLVSAVSQMSDSYLTVLTHAEGIHLQLTHLLLDYCSEGTSQPSANTVATAGVTSAVHLLPPPPAGSTAGPALPAMVLAPSVHSSWDSSRYRDSPGVQLLFIKREIVLDIAKLTLQLIERCCLDPVLQSDLIDSGIHIGLLDLLPLLIESNVRNDEDQDGDTEEAMASAGYARDRLRTSLLLYSPDVDECVCGVLRVLTYLLKGSAAVQDVLMSPVSSYSSTLYRSIHSWLRRGLERLSVNGDVDGSDLVSALTTVNNSNESVMTDADQARVRLEREMGTRDAVSSRDTQDSDRARGTLAESRASAVVRHSVVGQALVLLLQLRHHQRFRLALTEHGLVDLIVQYISVTREHVSVGHEKELSVHVLTHCVQIAEHGSGHYDVLLLARGKMIPGLIALLLTPLASVSSPKPRSEAGSVPLFSLRPIDTKTKVIFMLSLLCQLRPSPAFSLDGKDKAALMGLLPYLSTVLNTRGDHFSPVDRRGSGDNDDNGSLSECSQNDSSEYFPIPADKQGGGTPKDFNSEEYTDLSTGAYLSGTDEYKRDMKSLQAAALALLEAMAFQRLLQIPTLKNTNTNVGANGDFDGSSRSKMEYISAMVLIIRDGKSMKLRQHACGVLFYITSQERPTEMSKVVSVILKDFPEVLPLLLTLLVHYPWAGHSQDKRGNNRDSNESSPNDDGPLALNSSPPRSGSGGKPSKEKNDASVGRSGQGENEGSSEKGKRRRMSGGEISARSLRLYRYVCGAIFNFIHGLSASTLHENQRAQYRQQILNLEVDYQLTTTLTSVWRVVRTRLGACTSEQIQIASSQFFNLGSESNIHVLYEIECHTVGILSLLCSCTGGDAAVMNAFISNKVLLLLLDALEGLRQFAPREGPGPGPGPRPGASAVSLGVGLVNSGTREHQDLVLQRNEVNPLLYQSVTPSMDRQSLLDSISTCLLYLCEFESQQDVILNSANYAYLELISHFIDSRFPYPIVERFLTLLSNLIEFEKDGREFVIASTSTFAHVTKMITSEEVRNSHKSVFENSFKLLWFLSRSGSTHDELRKQRQLLYAVISELRVNKMESKNTALLKIGDGNAVSSDVVVSEGVHRGNGTDGEQRIVANTSHEEASNDSVSGASDLLKEFAVAILANFCVFNDSNRQMLMEFDVLPLVLPLLIEPTVTVSVKDKVMMLLKNLMKTEAVANIVVKRHKVIPVLVTLCGHVAVAVYEKAILRSDERVDAAGARSSSAGGGCKEGAEEEGGSDDDGVGESSDKGCIEHCLASLCNLIQGSDSYRDYAISKGLIPILITKIEGELRNVVSHIYESALLILYQLSNVSGAVREMVQLGVCEVIGNRLVNETAKSSSSQGGDGDEGNHICLVGLLQNMYTSDVDCQSTIDALLPNMISLLQKPPYSTYSANIHAYNRPLLESSNGSATSAVRSPYSFGIMSFFSSALGGRKAEKSGAAK
eukprot:gene429-454_t